MFRRKEELHAPKISSVEPDPEESPPVFSLRYLQRNYCVADCDQKDRAAFAMKLKEMSSLTWKALQLAPRHGMGKENIPVTSIKAPKPALITPDVKNVWAFRFSGKAPMVGLRRGAVFYVLWIDRAFKLYDHGS